MSAHAFNVGSEHLFTPHLEFREHDQEIEERSHFSLDISSIYLLEKELISIAFKRAINIVS